MLYTSYHCDIRRNEVIILSLSKNEFLVLREIVRTRAAPTKIVEATGLSLGSVNSAAKSLSAAGLIADGEPTEAGAAALEPYRVENAIILAAGLSSRFAPISYEKPKGLLKVRGEVLIERQIEQLLARRHHRHHRGCRLQEGVLLLP